MRIDKIDNENYNVYIRDKSGKETKAPMKIDHEKQAVCYTIEDLNSISNLYEASSKLGLHVFGPEIWKN
jgi:phage terminase large subunit